MLVWACIAPHGGELIPELATEAPHRMAKTRAAMQELGHRCKAQSPDTIVVYTPHGVYDSRAITVSECPFALGMLEGEGDVEVCADFEVDLPLADALAHRAGELGVSVAKTPLYTLENGTLYPYKMDWGAFVPLWFMGADWPVRPKVVIVCPSRALPREQLMAFGQATVDVAVASGKRIAVIASADQGHGHHAEGPYGFTPASAIFDTAYCDAIRQADLPVLLSWEEPWIEAALTDSYWQTLMLHGALRHLTNASDSRTLPQGVLLAPELLSYEAPTYFGMACAAFEPHIPSCP